jgi:hypothetical protein
MIRRIAIAALGLALVAGPAAAYTKTTAACIKTTRNAYKQCLVTCKGQLSTNLPQCFGPGAACATACQNGQNACQLGTEANPGPAAALAAANVECQSTQQAAITACKAGDPNVQDSCIADAKSAGLQCKLAARAAAAPGLADCSNAFNECLQTCASSN